MNTMSDIIDLFYFNCTYIFTAKPPPSSIKNLFSTKRIIQVPIYKEVIMISTEKADREIANTEASPIPNENKSDVAAVVT